MQQTIPAHLASTYQLIQCAFPQGIDDSEYLPLLAILYEHLSDRALAQVIAELTQKDYPIVLNDVYRVGATGIPADDQAILAQVQQKLQHCDYETWLHEE